MASLVTPTNWPPDSSGLLSQPSVVQRMGMGWRDTAVMEGGPGLRRAPVAGPPRPAPLCACIAGEGISPVGRHKWGP